MFNTRATTTSILQPHLKHSEWSNSLFCQTTFYPSLLSPLLSLFLDNQQACRYKKMQLRSVLNWIRTLTFLIGISMLWSVLATTTKIRAMRVGWLHWWPPNQMAVLHRCHLMNQILVVLYQCLVRVVLLRALRFPPKIRKNKIIRNKRFRNKTNLLKL